MQLERKNSYFFRKSALCCILAMLLGGIISGICAAHCRPGSVAQLLAACMPLHLFAVGTAFLTLLPLVKAKGWRTAFAVSCLNLKERGLRLLGFLCLLKPIIWGLAWLSEQMCLNLGIPVVEQAIAKLPPNAGVGYILVLFLFTVAVAPVSEELLFRHIFYQVINSYWHGGATVLVSILFAVLHCCPQFVIPLFVLAIVLQKMYIRGGVALSIAFHAMFNFCSFFEILFAR